MPSVIYNSALDDEARGLIDYDTDSFKVMLVTSAYVPNKDTHLKRSDITNEVVGAGYVAGGATVTVAVTKDLANDRVDISLGAASWAASTITARGAVYYKSRGGLASADEIVTYNDFGADITSTAGTFSLAASILRKQNLT
ncbi:hypothetical protein [Bradyrhizobium sp.]|uniref:hypothetical protein n=1 Tax=Bradyrhizobium sp. TaxID=376 RepID=UPI0025C2CC29|nr:hypothetical protein [Bradyrhizobium sp.]